MQSFGRWNALECLKILSFNYLFWTCPSWKMSNPGCQFVTMRTSSSLWRWSTSPRAYSTKMRSVQFFSISNFPSHTSPRPLWHQDLQWLEFFAGKAACTYAMRRAGYLSARFDKLYFDPACQRKRKSNWHDILTPSGFMSLGWILAELICLSVHATGCCKLTLWNLSCSTKLGHRIHLEGQEDWLLGMVRDQVLNMGVN